MAENNTHFIIIILILKQHLYYLESKIEKYNCFFMHARSENNRWNAKQYKL